LNNLGYFVLGGTINVSQKLGGTSFAECAFAKYLKQNENISRLFTYFYSPLNSSVFNLLTSSTFFQ